MRKNLPRHYLWKEKRSLEEFLDHALFKELHNVYLEMEKTPMLFQMDELTILNEVGYEVTWLCYQSGYGNDVDMDQFVREIYANTGQNDHAEAVISLVHAIVTLVNFPPLNVSKHTKQTMKKLNNESWCGHFVNSLIKRMNKEGRFFDESFKPYEDAMELYKERTKYFRQILEYDEKMLGICPENNDESMVCAEEVAADYDEMQDHIRRFTLDEIVDYAENNLTVEMAMPIQGMLYALMVDDGTKEEREKVVSITPHIINRDHICMNINKFEKPVGAVLQTDGKQRVEISQKGLSLL